MNTLIQVIHDLSAVGQHQRNVVSRFDKLIRKYGHDSFRTTAAHSGHYKTNPITHDE